MISKSQALQPQETRIDAEVVSLPFRRAYCNNILRSSAAISETLVFDALLDRLNCIREQHGDGHGTDAARHRRNR